MGEEEKTEAPAEEKPAEESKEEATTENKPSEEEEEEVIEEGAEEVVEKEGKKYVTATLSVESDADLIRSYDLVRKVGNFSNTQLLSFGIEAAKQSEEFKARVTELKGAL